MPVGGFGVDLVFGGLWGIRDVADPAGLPILLILFTVFSALATPVQNSIIRENESEADIFGLNAVREPDAFATAIVKLSQYRKLDPSPLEEIIFYDHPSGRTRVHMAMQWKAEHLNDLPRRADAGSSAGRRSGRAATAATERARATRPGFELTGSRPRSLMQGLVETYMIAEREMAREGSIMNWFKTGILLAVLTGLFVAIGWLIGGTNGMVIAFLVAARDERLRLLEFGQDGAAHVRRAARSTSPRRPNSSSIVRELAGRAGLPMPQGLHHRQPAAQRLRHRPQSRACRGRRHHRPPQHLVAARSWRACWRTSSATSRTATR